VCRNKSSDHGKFPQQIVEALAPGETRWAFVDDRAADRCSQLSCAMGFRSCRGLAVQVV
jgi:hypothetical protein